MCEGIVFNIQKYSIHDGPGIRTTVFLKGCPLRCLWCHNPESQSFRPELVFYEKRCIGCGECLKQCKQNAIEEKQNCINCGSCAEVCFANAREIAGKRMTVNEVMLEIEKDRIFYESSGGGVTFSGGEPLSQPDFLEELLKRCKKDGFHTVVDTCGFIETENIIKLSPFIDLFLYDLKTMDASKHTAYTGVSNKIILDNLKVISDLGKRIFIRMPIIPGMNDEDKDLEAEADFIKGLHGVEQINLLPYHHIGKEKYKRLNKAYELEHVNEPDALYMENKAAIFINKGMKVKIGG